ncbi:MAG: GAF domain-containing protein [Myxococcales bacterium]|nr:GAF domain-containing protein [Myxococcales bacterium]
MTTGLEPRASRVGAAVALSELTSMLRADGRFAGKPVTQPHPLVVSVREGDRLILLSPATVWNNAREIFKPFASHFGDSRAALVLLGQPTGRSLDEALNRGLVATVQSSPSVDEVHIAVHNALQLLDAIERAEKRGVWVNRYRYEIGELLEIAQAITTERDIDKLLALILEKSRFITGADAGSIYVVEGDDPDITRRWLHFKLTQNDSLSIDFSEFTVPINERSISGFVALHREALNIADVYRIPADSPYGFDPSYDAKIGYRTKSMLTTPLLSRVGEVIGVLQLINKKHEPSAKLINVDEELSGVIPFDSRSEDLLTTLASLAGIALENAILYAENKTMLEGFVRASVEAIEQRDPTTSGHSIRVAEMTVALALAVERQETGPYKDVSWRPDDVKELEYASLLHDFGKIGVREQVLVKAKKLYPYDMAAIERRFALAVRSLEVMMLQKKVEAMEDGASTSDLKRLDEELARRREELHQALALIREANEPKVLTGGDFAMIEQLATLTYLDEHSQPQPLLSPGEVECLCVPRGSLTPAEFDEIRSHVVHTFEFLKTIPWGRKFRRVAQIAGAHHERLDGTGYPNRLHGPEIPLQSKMMTVSDIFDALTAADRPYKRAVPLSRALDILGMEVKQGHIDGELVRIFTDAKAWTTLDNPPT